MAYEMIIDGFDTYATADITKYWPQSSNVAISAGNGRNGTNCLTKTSLVSYLVSPSFATSACVTVGFAVKASSGAFNPLVIRYGETVQVTLGMDELRRLVVGSNVSTNQLADNQYTYIEMGVVHGDSGSVEVRVDGTSVGWIPQVTMDTKVGAAPGINNLYIGGSQNYGSWWSIDDLYIAYGNELKFCGDSRVLALPLTGNGADQDWAVSSGTAWSALNEQTGYIYSNTPDDLSMFALTNLPYTPEIIHGVQMRGRAKKDGAETREIELVMQRGAGEQTSDTLALSTSDQGLTTCLTVDPALGSAWTESNVNAALIGVRLVT